MGIGAGTKEFPPLAETGKKRKEIQDFSGHPKIGAGSVCAKGAQAGQATEGGALARKGASRADWCACRSVQGTRTRQRTCPLGARTRSTCLQCGRARGKPATPAREAGAACPPRNGGRRVSGCPITRGGTASLLRARTANAPLRQQRTR